jgi:hypothetical protein
METIEERLAKSPVSSVIEVIDAREELKRRADQIRRLEVERECRGDNFTKCPSCGWPGGHSG